ncbi:mitochondria-eating protein isoform X1 [Phyllopteryx taeniolatus]|uniref:mitochondria-eating protein isoform X1 n=1 Tax=Phyllopteryx taeniolatus TaxID=161469 RepID=UPI002AD4246B|nr:mitochondria-eating protein isoform X1 [Phyllopteryx taeniolatus]
MSDALNSLVTQSCFSVLQDRLERWQREYHVISCDENMNRCCEMIEFTAKIQGQLFAVLNSVAAEGEHTDGVSTLKTRLLPWLGTCFSPLQPPAHKDNSFNLLQDLAEKERKLTELNSGNTSDMQWVESQLCSTRLQLDSVKAELDDAHRDLNTTNNKTASNLLEDELLQLKEDLRGAHLQKDLYKKKLDSYHDYERQMSKLRAEVSYRSSQRLARSNSARTPAGPRYASSPLGSEATPRSQLTGSSRLTRVVSRFSDLYNVERKDAQFQLQGFINDLETVQRIIFIAIVESFKAAKLAHRLFRLRARKTLSVCHFGPESLEDTVVDYVVRNQDLYDVQNSVDEVLSAMNLNPRIASIPKVNFSVASPLIRETCKLAFTMQTLDPPIDLAFASDGELYIGNKYRRSPDSDLSAELVLYHVWPALMQGGTVRCMGEVVTKKGAVWKRSAISYIRSRSLSPTRNPTFNDGMSASSPDAIASSCL